MSKANIGKNLGGLLKALFRPSINLSMATLIGIGIIVGLTGFIGFNTVLYKTNTESFCISCHEMESGPFEMLQDTTHFQNRSGVRPTCPDCHVPKAFLPKMIRKIEASREVWSHFTGKIATPEKYLEHVHEMKAREIKRMRANDSAECRQCHEVESMLFEQQSEKAQKYHQILAKGEKSCIDCHQGLAHTPESTLWDDKADKSHIADHHNPAVKRP